MSNGSARNSPIFVADDELEMSTLEDIAVTPDPRRKVHFDDTEYEDDFDGNDDGGRALLGLQGRTRGRERLSIQKSALWAQIKDMVIQTAPTLLFTTLGLLFTGELLDHVSQWRAMTSVDELIIMIPVILNLKGNLEMNLSARLGTAANMGDLDSPDVRRDILLGNMSLLQVQATLVSLVAASISFVLGLVMPRKVKALPVPPVVNGTIVTDGALLRSFTRDVASFALPSLHAMLPRVPRPIIPVEDGRPKAGISEFIMVASTAICSACLSSLLLGSFMCLLVVTCRRFRLNPDNIAPPIASCLGDLVTLTLLGFVSSILIQFISTSLPFILALLLVLSALTCAYNVRQNPHVRGLLTEGWSPLFGAMAISTGTGIVLDVFVSRYEGYALLAIIIGGLPGSVGSIFVSRLSTSLHRTAANHLPPSVHHKSDRGASSGEASTRLVTFTLFLIALPLVCIFLTAMRVLGWVQLPALFLAFAVIFFCAAVMASLLIAQLLTYFLWSKRLDPDTYALPIQSSLVDLVGQLLLVACYEIASSFGAHVQNQTS